MRKRRAPIAEIHQGCGDHSAAAAHDEFAGWRETAHLLSNSRNAEHLLQSLREANRGSFVEQELSDAPCA